MVGLLPKLIALNCEFANRVFIQETKLGFGSHSRKSTENEDLASYFQTLS